MSLRHARDEVVARPGLTGRALTEVLAATADAWLAAVWAAAVAAGTGPDAIRGGAAGPRPGTVAGPRPGRASGSGPGTVAGRTDEPTDVALLAVGGYGRGELAPAGDLDLLIVHRRRPDIAALAERVWYPIWDDGIELDHSVRTLRELGAAMDADLRVAVGLLDVRTVAGSRVLGAEVRRAVLDKWQARRDRWLPALGEMTAARHRAFGDLAFLLEPDLKEARGGLRDLHLLGALGCVVPDIADPTARGRLDPSGGVLVDARVERQRLVGRPGNELLLQDQDAVAAALGTDADGLMADVAAAGREVAWASDDVWRRLGRVPRRRFGARSWSTRPLEPGLALRDGEIAFLPGAEPAEDAALAVRAAARSAEMDVPLSRAAVDRLAFTAAPTGPWSDGLRQAFLRLLGAGPSTVVAFETLDRQGVVGRLLPEWAAVRNRPQRNGYHRFTVDRHLIETAVEASALVRRVARPDLLLLGGFLHDIGKGSPGDHSEAGVSLVEEIGPRLGLPRADVTVLALLVRRHLLLPDVATRRDLDDAATVASVAAAVGDRATLDLLAALAEADGRATGPAAWGPWKAELVERLMERVGRELRGEPLPAPSEPTAAQRRLVRIGRLAVRIQGSEVTVVAHDRPGLLASVAGVLALDGAAIRAARTLHGGPGTMLLTFDVTPLWDRLPSAGRLEADLRAVLDHRLSLSGALAALDGPGRWRPESRRAVRPEEPAVVVTVDDTSATATLVEVRAPDGRGTLARIAGALDAAGVRVLSLRADTLGADVVDTFSVREASTNEKLHASSRHEQMVTAIFTAVSGDPS